MSASLHGLGKPAWYVRRRGLSWLKHGFCPCCYSSPPLAECPVCQGSYAYGNPLIERELWRARWDELTS